MISLTEIAIITSNYLVLSKFTTIAHSANIPFKDFIWKYRRDLLLCELCYRPQTDCLTVLHNMCSKEMTF